jgi:hypothetical protein
MEHLKGAHLRRFLTGAPLMYCKTYIFYSKNTRINYHGKMVNYHGIYVYHHGQCYKTSYRGRLLQFQGNYYGNLSL